MLRPSPGPTTEFPCSECDEDPSNAENCCFECQALLCTFHTENHRRTKTTRGHKLDKISELGPIAQQLAAPSLQDVPIDTAAPIFSTSSVGTTWGPQGSFANPQQWWDISAQVINFVGFEEF